MIAPLFRHLNEHGYRFSMITTRTSSHVILLLEEERGPVALFKSFVEQRPLLKHPCDGLFLSSSVANETENLKIWFKLNQFAKIP